MAGILDNKERVLDFIITQEGKRQAGSGELRAKFASFTDYHTFYEKSGSLARPMLADDASDRIFFEAYSRYQDVIVPELEAGMSLQPFGTSEFRIVGNTISSGTLQSGFINKSTFITGSDLPDIVDSVLLGIERNFTDQRIVSSIDEYSYSNNFVLSDSTISFQEKFTNFAKSSAQNSGKVLLENIPSIFHDKRFGQFPNFLFLPPRNLPFPGEEEGSILADYPKLDEKPIETFDDILNSLSGQQSAEIKFSETSRANNFLCQIFESSDAGYDKLSVIDFGSFDTDQTGKRVFYIGKIRKDSTGAETFLGLFTIILE